MKILFFSILLLLGNCKMQAQSSLKANLPLNESFSVFINGGLAEVLAFDQNAGLIPVSNVGAGYNFTDKISVVAETMYYHKSFNRSSNMELESSNDFSNTVNYGLAFRFLGRKHEYCPTPFIQSGIYLSGNNSERSSNWIISPGFMYSLHEDDQLFLQIIGDFQGLELIQGKPFLVTAKLGLSYYF